jgi:hypothetical protein
MKASCIENIRPGDRIIFSGPNSISPDRDGLVVGVLNLPPYSVDPNYWFIVTLPSRCQFSSSDKDIVSQIERSYPSYLKDHFLENWHLAKNYKFISPTPYNFGVGDKTQFYRIVKNKSLPATAELA